jgi:WhiB family redox-sensing transcriptional regulator
MKLPSGQPIAAVIPLLGGVPPLAASVADGSVEQVSKWQEVLPVLTTARPHLVRYEPGELSDSNLASQMYQNGRCTNSHVDPDQWFPVANNAEVAREEAADAINVCVSCPVRAECLEYSLRHWSGFGVYGVWGGMVEGERRLLRRRWLGGARVTEFLEDAPLT